MLHYPFPIIREFRDVMPFLDEENFRIKEEDTGLTYINYVRMGNETFPDIPHGAPEEETWRARVRRECRGIAFHTDSGRIASRPFHKFFNFGEREEVSANSAGIHERYYVTEKLDGSMIRPLPTPYGIRWGTKMGITDVGKLAEEFLVGKHNYEELAQYCISCEFTPIFEFCSNKCRIVIDYPEDRMVLLALRNNISGEYMPHKFLAAFAHKFGVEVVEQAYINSDISVIDYAALKKQDTEGEGVVLTYYTGHRLKVKHDWYVKVHKAKEMLASERHFISLYLDDKIDDLYPVLPEEDKDRADAYIGRLEGERHRLGYLVEETYKQMRAQYETKRDFAIGEKDISPWLRGLIFALWDGKVPSPIEAVDRLIQKNLSSGKRFESLKTETGFNAQWEGIALEE